MEPFFYFCNLNSFKNIQMKVISLSLIAFIALSACNTSKYKTPDEKNNYIYRTFEERGVDFNELSGPQGDSLKKLEGKALDERMETYIQLKLKQHERMNYVKRMRPIFEDLKGKFDQNEHSGHDINLGNRIGTLLKEFYTLNTIPEATALAKKNADLINPDMLKDLIDNPTKMPPDPELNY